MTRDAVDGRVVHGKRAALEPRRGVALPLELLRGGGDAVLVDQVDEELERLDGGWLIKLNLGAIGVEEVAAVVPDPGLVVAAGVGGGQVGGPATGGRALPYGHFLRC